MSAILDTAKGAWGLLGQARPGPTATAYLLYLLCLLLAGLRWRIVLRGMGHEVRLRDTFSVNMMSIFVNNVVPGRMAGELCRIGMLRVRAGVALAPGTASNGYDRLLDLLPLGCMTLIALPLLWPLVGGALRQASAPALRILGLVAAVLVLVLLLARRAARRSGRGWRDRLRSQWVQLSAFRVSRSALGLAGGCSFVLWFLDGVRFWLIASALQVHLSPGRALLLVVVATLAGLLPSLGGLGAVEGGLTAALMLFGVSAERALAITALERILSYFLTSLAGAVLLLLLSGAGALRALRSAAGGRQAAEGGPDLPTER